MLKKKDQIVKKEPEAEILTEKEVKMLDEAAKVIMEKANAGAQSIIEIGEYLLKTFFDDDINKVTDRASRKGISLRKLAEHPDMHLSLKTLSNAVRLAVLEKTAFKDSEFKELSPSHKILLLNVADDEQRTNFANKVVLGKLSVRTLRTELGKAGLLSERGRPHGEVGSEVEKTISTFSDFYKPLEKLLKNKIEIETMDVSKISEDESNMLLMLKIQLEVILERIKK